MSQFMLTALFALALSFLTLAASFAGAPGPVTQAQASGMPLLPLSAW
jgi:hypothetical protein